MADFAKAVAKTLDTEQGFNHVLATGEVVNHGITHWFLRAIGKSPSYPPGTKWAVPATAAEIQYVKSLTKSDAVTLYNLHFWLPNRCDMIDSQTLAEKFFDLSVNTGPETVTKLLQRAVNSCIPNPIAADGRVGPITIKAINGGDEACVMLNFRKWATAHYKDIATRKPELSGNLKGWLNRVDG